MRGTRFVVLVAIFAVFLSACGGNGASPKPRVVIGSTLEPATMDLTASSQAAIPEILLYNVYEGLVRIDNDGNLKPLLAESWEQSSDGTVYTFKLRKAKFHDGTDFTAEDVVFTLDRNRAADSKHPFKKQYEVISKVDAVDDQTVRVTLTQFSYNWLLNMALSAGVILSKDSVAKIATEPVGTGPFKFGTWTRGTSISLVRNTEYWGKRPPLDEVVFKYITDPNAMTNALLAGDLDIVSRVTAPELIPSLKKDARFRIVEGLTNGEVVLAMNNTDGPLKDVRVRKAITMAIDRDGLINAAYGGFGKRIGSHVPPTDPWYVDLNSTYPFDRTAAKRLLTEAGYPQGFPLTLHLPPPSYARRSGEVVASQLKEIGIDVKIMNVEFPQWLDTVLTKGQYQLSIVAHVEPRDIVQYGNKAYYWHYDNVSVAQWLQQADSERNEKARNDLYAKVQRQISDDAVNDWLFLLPEIAAMSKGITGYKQNRISFSIDMSEVSYAA